MINFDYFVVVKCCK